MTTLKAWRKGKELHPGIKWEVLKASVGYQSEFNVVRGGEKTREWAYVDKDGEKRMATFATKDAAQAYADELNKAL